MRAKINSAVVSAEAWASALEKLFQYWPFLLWFGSMTGLGTWLASGTTALEGQGWGAYALAGLVVACIVTLVASAALVAWRFFRANSAATDDPPGAIEARAWPSEPPEPNGPPTSPIELIAYNELVAFAIDRLLPTCEAILDLQSAIIALRCTDKEVARLARSGLWHEYQTAKFWEAFEALETGLCESPGPIISMDRMIEHIHEIEVDYKKIREYTTTLAQSANIDPSALPDWNAWRARHNELVGTYEAIKRDSRFGKLFRPARVSRWGGLV